VLAKRQNVVLDVYGMSFAINTRIWLLSLDCLNTWIIDEVCNRKCGIRRPRLGPYLHAIIEHVKDDIPHHHQNLKILVKFELIGLRYDGHVY